jgi:hypothetical protein
LDKILMTRTRAVFAILCCLLLCDLWLYAVPARAQRVTAANELDAGRIVWKALTFKAKSFLASVENDIELKILPAAEAKKSLISSPTGRVLDSAGSDLFCVTVSSVIEPIIGGPENISSQAWYTPKPAAALQRIRLRQGQEQWQKTYRFTDIGVYRLRKKPGSPDEAAKSLAHWTDSEGSFYAYGAGNDGCLHVMEPSILMYIASIIDPESEAAPLSLCVFNKKQLHRVQIQRAGVTRMEVDYRVTSGERKFWRKEEIQALKLVFRTRSLAGPDEEAEPFSFLGLKGDFDIYVDQASRIPVQVSGNIPRMGGVTVRLRKVGLKQTQ